MPGAGPREGAAQQDEDRTVVDEAVQQDDRGLLLGGEPGCVGRGECGHGRPPLLCHPGRIEQQMSREDRQLQGGRLEKGDGQTGEPGRQKALTERNKGRDRPGDLHARPPVADGRTSLSPVCLVERPAVRVADGGCDAT